MLTGLNIMVRASDSLYTLQRAVFEAVMAGDLHPRDVKA
jgi:hypothetical protein